jgi:hypothetical protein
MDEARMMGRAVTPAGDALSVRQLSDVVAAAAALIAPLSSKYNYQQSRQLQVGARPGRLAPGGPAPAAAAAHAAQLRHGLERALGNVCIRGLQALRPQQCACVRVLAWPQAASKRQPATGPCPSPHLAASSQPHGCLPPSP